MRRVDRLHENVIEQIAVFAEVRGGEARDGDDRQRARARLAADGSRHVRAAQTGEGDVGDDRVDALPLEVGEGVFGAFELLDDKPFEPQILREQLTCVRIVVDHGETRRRRGERVGRLHDGLPG